LTHFDAETVLEALLRAPNRYSEWEKSFLESVDKQNAYKGFISDAQETIIRRIATQYNLDVARFSAHWFMNETPNDKLQSYRKDNKHVDEYLSHQEYWEKFDEVRSKPHDDAGEAWLREHDPRRKRKK